MKARGIIVASILCSILLTQAPGAAIEYNIGPGDVIEISVWRDESLNRQVVVPPDGIISFPLIGDIDTQGMTVADVRNTITQRLSEYVQDAVVTVMILEINSMNVYVIGKVKSPGAFTIFADTNVMQVLSKAGGLNPFASEKEIHILRQENDDTVKIPFNYKEVLKGKNLEQNIVLQRGDVVVVP
jgi:polysaccharide export outer membrane protein